MVQFNLPGETKPSPSVGHVESVTVGSTEPTLHPHSTTADHALKVRAESLSGLAVEVLHQVDHQVVSSDQAKHTGRVLDDAHLDSTDTKVKLNVKASLFTVIKNFFAKLLSFFYANPSWRVYEKYHYLSEQTLEGIMRVINDPDTKRTEADKQAMNRLLEEVKTPGFVPQRADAGSSPQERCRFHLQSALCALKRAAEAEREEKVDCRSCHKEFLIHLRQALELNADGKQMGSEFALAEEICFSMYTQCNMANFSKSLLDFVTNNSSEISAHAESNELAAGNSVDTPSLDDDEPRESMATGLSSQLEEGAISHLERSLHQVHDLHADIKSSERSHTIATFSKAGQSLRGELRFLGFDPNLQGNPPYRKFDIQTRDGKVVRNLRLATPTIGSRINPEFLGYLRALRVRGKKHIYVNLQNNRGSDGEGIRSRLLQQLGDEYKDVLTVMTLDKNSDFYFQKKEHGLASMPAETFKSSLFQRLTQEKLGEVPTGCYLPASLKTPAFEKKLEAIVDGVHTNMFGGRADLTVEERKNFIEMVYMLMVDAAVAESGADEMNTSCKDCIDRGGGANALLYYSLSMLSESHMTESDKQKNDALLAAMTFSDALWARKRAIIEERLDRAVEAAHAMLEVQQTTLSARGGGQVTDEADAPTPFEWLRSQMQFQSARVPEALAQPIRS